MKEDILLSGQFRIVKKSQNGQVLFDSGELNNLLLDTGLDYFGDDTGRNNMLAYLAIGTGNSEPVVTQNRLDTAVAIRSGAYHSHKDDYDEVRDGEYFTTSQTYKYRFDGLNNVNIAELGLVNSATISNYIAYTRALIKDDTGRPLVITVLQGEILEVYYTLKQVFRLQDKQFRLALSDGRGGTRGFVNCTMRLCGVGMPIVYESLGYGKLVGAKADGGVGNITSIVFAHQDLAQVTAIPNRVTNQITKGTAPVTKSDYQIKSFKRVVNFLIPENYNLPKLGLMVLPTTMGFYQVSFSNENDNTMIDKNNTRTFSIGIELTWSRDNRG